MNRSTTLGEISNIITGPFGSQLHMSDYVDEGIPVIMPQDIVDGTVSLENIVHICEDDYNRLIRYAVKVNDIIFARRGDIEKHAFITNNNKLLCGTGCFRVRITDSAVYPLFLSYFLDQLETRRWLAFHSVGSNMPNLNTAILSSVPVNLPNYATQVKIGDFFYNIEKKIQCSKKINDNLQQMAMITYMHLFFGKKCNGKLGDILIENPKSTIQVNEAKGKSGDYPFFTSGDAILRWTEPIVDGRNIFLNTGGNADIKFYIGKTAYSTDTWCVTAKNDMEDYLYLLLNSIRQELNLKFFQGTGLKHLQKPLLKNRPIYIPSNEEISAFNADIKPWFTLISDNIRESYRLSALRDWLLPMLMNDQVSIINEQAMGSKFELSNFEKWIASQGYAARGNVNIEILRNVYEAMDDDDK